MRCRIMEVGLVLVSIEDEFHVHANRPRMVPERADESGMMESMNRNVNCTVALFKFRTGRRSSGAGDECFGPECAFLNRPLRTS